MSNGRSRSTVAMFRRGAARHTGLALALGVGGIFALVLGVAAFRARPAAEDGPREKGEAPPDIKSVLSGSGAASGLASGERPFVQVVDKADPTRIRAEISADRSEPLEGKRYKLERPRAWIVMSDTRVAHVQADSARALIPGEGGDSRPQDALLEGNVLIRLYQARNDGRWPDLADDAPDVTLTTSSMRFDGTLGRAEFPDAVRIDSREAVFAGRGVTILFNEGAERLERLSIVRTDWMVVRGAGSSNMPPTTNGSLAAATTAGAGSLNAPARDSTAFARTGSSLSEIVDEQRRDTDASATESQYKIVADTDVRIVQGARSIRADRADVWLRLVGNRLRPDAIAGLTRASHTSTLAVRGGATPMPLAMRVASLLVASMSQDRTWPAMSPATSPATSPSAPPVPALGDSDTLLTWAGPLEVVPLELAPRELARNDVYVKFVADPDSRVSFADQEALLEGNGESVEYGATRRELVLAGVDERPARARVAGSGSITTTRLEIDASAGHARVPGPGEVVGEADRAGRIAWTQEASLDFVTLNSGEARIAQARAAGDVVATDGSEAQVRANVLVAKFAEVEDGASRPELVQAIGNVVASDGRDGTLAADSVDVMMVRIERATEPGSAATWDDAPARLVARGNARVQRGGERISARSIDAGLSQDASGATEVVSLVARDEVAVATPDGGSASGDELTAWPTEQRAEIRGTPAFVARTGTRIDGPFVRLEGEDRRITVVGPGTFSHEGEAKELGGAGRAEASWSRSMSYADVDGIAVFRGEANAAWTSPRARDRAQGEEIVLQIDPAQPDEGDQVLTQVSERVPDQAANQPNNAPSRRVLNATVRGSAASPTAPATPALVEARRYAPDDANRLERLLYLEGDSILADNTKNTLEVPSAGRLLVSDRTDDAGSPTPPGGRVDLMGSRSRGDTLFSWTGSLLLRRDDGAVTLTRGVRMSHEDASGGLTELESARLVATFIEDGAGLAAPAAGGTTPFAASLRTVTASGAAWMRSAGREMAADSLSFDAAAQIVTALPPPNGTVVLLDPSQGAGPVRAESLRWDLSANRVEAKGIRTIVVPR